MRQPAETSQLCALAVGVSAMRYTFPPDLRNLVEARLASGLYSTEDDVLRDALRALAAEDEDLAAVRDAVAEWRAGDIATPLAEVIELVRNSRNAKGQR